MPSRATICLLATSYMRYILSPQYQVMPRLAKKSRARRWLLAAIASMDTPARFTLLLPLLSFHARYVAARRADEKYVSEGAHDFEQARCISPAAAYSRVYVRQAAGASRVFTPPLWSGAREGYVLYFAAAFQRGYFRHATQSFEQPHYVYH